MPKYEIQHESDDEPTYVVKAGTDEEVVTFSPSLPWELRQKLAEMILAELEKPLPESDPEQNPELDDKVQMRWRNLYRCPRCKHEWDDCWDCQCDDDCPECGCRHVSPYESEEIEQSSQDV